MTMTYQDSLKPVSRAFPIWMADRLVGFLRTLRFSLRTPFDERHDALRAEVERLRALDDDALARLGLRRADILWHVFA
ncbi:hypothetical protein [Primorskyibacter marinus]|uniref:hypothetical protein n=1 Tax=Primorskyibacter marinus TaxID=1977320 RepID=UPI001300AB08|nr:hypothetical protein [Primorskyibacter marinus]